MAGPRRTDSRWSYVSATRIVDGLALFALFWAIAWDLANGAFRSRHALFTSLVASLIVLAVTVAVVDEVLEHRQRARGRGRAVRAARFRPFGSPLPEMSLRRVEINGGPGAMYLDRQQRLISVVALDIADDQITGIRSVVSPNKLKHLGTRQRLHIAAEVRELNRGAVKARCEQRRTVLSQLALIYVTRARQAPNPDPALDSTLRRRFS